MRYTLAQYFNMLYKLNIDVGFKTLGRVFSDMYGEQRKDQYGVFPNLVFSQEHPTYSQRESKNVMIVRGVMDVMVSLYHHYSFSGNSIGSMYSTILTDKRFIES